MAHSISRRALVGGIGMVSAEVGSFTASASEGERTLSGTVAWCNWRRGLLKCHAEPRTSGALLIKLKVDASEQARLRCLRPSSPVAIKVAWCPDLDVLSPWVPLEVISATGEHFATAIRPVMRTVCA